MSGCWGLTVGLLALLGGGALLTCGLLCAGLIAVVSSGKMDRDQAAATEAVPDPGPEEGGRPRRTHAVGFRRLTLRDLPGEEPARERQFLLWYPAPGKDEAFNYNGQQGYATLNAPVLDGAHPLILFSHGFLGAADQTIFLMEALARDGNIVAAIDHADAPAQRGQRPVSMPNFADAKSWDATRYRDRRDDLVALLDHLLKLNDTKDSFFHAHVNRQGVGAAGHSLGGYTVVGMLGGWPAWREPRVRAALLLSPYMMPYRPNTLRTLRTPVMLQGGTLDLGITPFLQDVYLALPGPKYYLVLKNETHFGWTNLISLGKTTTECVKQGNARLMTDYSLAFFRQHLRGEAAPLLQTKAAGLDAYLFQADPPQ